MKATAILLTVHNRKEKTLECLEKLFRQKPPESARWDVYMTDDGCTDGTSEAVSRYFPSVKIVRGNGQLFWNRGMYLAWKTAAQTRDYDYYLWLNDDTILLPDAIEELLACVDDRSPCLVCGACRSDKEEIFTYGAIDQKGKNVVPNGQIQEGYIINGNAVLVNRKAFLLIGMLDPAFPHAIGDFDYGLRLLAEGGRIFTTRKYIGYCNKNPKLPAWCYTSTPLKTRLKNLYSPLGNAHPVYFFKYEKRHFGIPLAIKHFFSIHLRVLFPTLWN